MAGHRCVVGALNACGAASTLGSGPACVWVQPYVYFDLYGFAFLISTLIDAPLGAV